MFKTSLGRCALPHKQLFFLINAGKLEAGL